jgi:hypothetical protein
MRIKINKLSENCYLMTDIDYSIQKKIDILYKTIFGQNFAILHLLADIIIDKLVLY